MTRRGGRGKGGDGFGYRRENNFGGNRKGKRNWGDRQEYHGGDGHNRPNFNRDRERNNDNSNGGFRKFTGTNSMSPRGYKSDQQHGFKSRNYNNHNAWVHNQGVNRFNENDEQNNPQVEEENSVKPSESVAPLEQAVQNNEPIRLKLKTENPDQVTTFPVQKSKPPKAKPEPSLNNESNSDEEDAQTVMAKTKEVSNIIPKIKIKKEQVDKPRAEKKEVVNKDPPVSRIVQPPPSTESSSSDSSNSSSSEEEEPQMPHPMRGGDVKPKKEKRSEDDVVCLGKLNKIENLVDNADSDDPSTCIVCKKPGHSSEDCQMKCRKCSQSSYQCQMVCRSCGETYVNGVQSFPKPPNPLLMFMQFMQFCMSQYSDMFTDNKFQIPQYDNSGHCPPPEPAPPVEVSRKDIENSKTNRKRNKSESKQSRKKARKTSQRNSDDDSDSSSMAASSTKRRKKRAKSVNREAEPTPTVQPQPTFGQHFGQTYPSSLPFGGSFNSPGYNPMLAFSQMMGYNPVGLNFTR